MSVSVASVELSIALEVREASLILAGFSMRLAP